MDQSVSRDFRWLVLVTMIFATSTAAFIWITPSAILAKFFFALPGLTPRQIVFVTIGGFQIVMFLAMIPGGLFMDRFGPLVTYIVALLMMAAGGLLMPVMGGSYWGMLFLRVLQAVAVAPVLVSSVPMAARHYPPQFRSVVIVVQGVAMMAGLAIGLSIMPRLAQNADGPQQFMAWMSMGIVPALILSCVAVWFHQRFIEKGSGTTRLDAGRIRQALSGHAIWGICICLVMATWISRTMNIVLPGYLKAGIPVGLGIDPVISGRVVAVAVIFGIVGMFSGVLFTERGLKGNMRPVVLAGFILPAIFILMLKGYQPADSRWCLWGYVMATYFTLAFVSPQLMGFIAKHFPVNSTGILGGMAMCITGFMGIAAARIGTNLLLSSSYLLSFEIMVAVALLGIIFFIFLGPDREDS